MQGDPEIINIPAIQYGFAGFCVILLSILVWLVKQLLAVLKDTHTVIDRNTQAMRDIAAQNQEIRNEINETRTELRALATEVSKSPCIAGKKR